MAERHGSVGDIDKVELVEALEAMKVPLEDGDPSHIRKELDDLIARLKAEQVECEHRWVPVDADRCEKCGAINYSAY